MDITGTHISIYFDPSDADIDGLGWNVAHSNGIGAYRFATLEDATSFLQNDSKFWTKELMREDA